MTFPLPHIPIRALCFLCALLLAGGPAVAASGDAVAAPVAAPRVIRVGYYGLPGFHNLDKFHGRSGYGYDLLQMLKAYTGWQYVYHGFDCGQDELITLLRHGGVDLVCGVEKNEELSQHFLYTALPVGYACLTLSVRPGQKRFLKGDYAHWNGMRIGFLLHDGQERSFEAFARSKGFTYDGKQFGRHADLVLALRNNEVDAVVSSSLRYEEREEVLERIALRPFYFIMRKDSVEWCQELNAALERLFLHQPEILKFLQEKYYGVPETVTPGFLPHTDDEQLFRQTAALKEQVYKVLIHPVNPPYSYFSNGRLMGILPDVLELLRKKTGLNLEPQYPSGSGEARNILQNSRADVVLDFNFDDLQRAEKLGYLLIRSYIKDPLVLTGPPEHLASPQTLAVVDGLYDSTMVRVAYSKAVRVLTCDSSQEAVRAVNQGEADVALLLSRSADYYLSQEDNSGLQSQPFPTAAPKRFGVAVNGRQDPAFISILTEGINSISRQEFEQIYANHLSKVSDDDGLLKTVSEHQLLICAGLLFFVFIPLIFIGFFFSALRKSPEGRKKSGSVALHKNTTIMLVIGVIGLIWLLLCGLLCFSAIQIHRLHKRALDVQQRRGQLMEAAQMFRLGSDKLTTRAQFFVSTGEPAHAAAYYHEANFGQLRNKALSQITTLTDNELVLGQMQSAMTLSLALMNTEKHAMKLAAAARSMVPSSLPSELGGYELSAAEEKLTPEKQDALARSLLFDSAYIASKKQIYDKLEQFVNYVQDQNELESHEIKQRQGQLNWIQGIYLSFCVALLITLVGITLTLGHMLISQREFESQLLVDNTALPIAMFDPSGKPIRCNQAYCDCLGLTFREIQKCDVVSGGLTPAMGVTTFGDDQSSPLARIYNQGEQDATAVFYQRGHTYEIHAKSVRDPGGTLLYVFEYILDITATEERNRRQKVINQVMEYAFLHNDSKLENMPLIIEAIVEYFKADGGFIWHRKTNGSIQVIGASEGCNQEFLEAFSRQTLSERAWADKNRRDNAIYSVVPSFSNDTAVAIGDTLCLSHGIGWLCGVRLMIQNQPWGELTLYFNSPRHTLTSDDIELLSTFQYTINMALLRIVLSRNQEQERIKALAERDRAIAAEKAKSFFFASVSHDIRTPLNAIIGFSELLEQGVEDPETGRQYLRSIRSSGDTLKQLINDVLDLAKLEAGKMSITPVPSDFNAITADMRAIFSKAAEDKHIELRLEGERLPLLTIDCQRIRQILFNLIGNAMKFTREGAVTIQSSFTPDTATVGTLHFAVADTGIGIAQEDIEKLMQPYVQIKTMNSTEGTGLGLSICKRMLECMKGHLEITSTLGKGSTFAVTMSEVPFQAAPAETKPAVATSAAEVASGAASYGQWSVLLADDSTVNLTLLKAMCAKIGVTDVRTAENGVRALDELRQRHYDLVLTDLWMPEMDGEGLVRAIRQEPSLRYLPVYVITADVEAQKNHRDLGFTGLLLKPITVEGVKALFDAAARLSSET